MKPKGVDRVVIAVRDLDKSIDLYSKLLGATFHNSRGTGEPFGFDVAISWDAGIELCAPLPGRESFISQQLEQNGEGIIGIVFGFDDADAARDQAEKMGVSVLIPIDYDQEQIDQYFQGRFKRYKEYMLSPVEGCNFGVILGQIEPKEDEG